MSTYNPAIPQATDYISTSQSQILVNFAQLNTQFGIDHVAFNTGSANGSGHHQQITFDENTTSSLGSSVGVVYPKDVSGTTALYLTTAAGDNAVWTGGAGSGLITQTVGDNQSNGTMAFPNGVIMKWGYEAPNIVSGTPILFPVAFPTACFTVVATPLKTDTTERAFYIKPGTISKTGFTPLTDSGSLGLTYFAVGN